MSSTETLDPIVEALLSLGKGNKYEGITPEAVLEAAKSPSSPLHGKFVWVDSEAAHKHRLWQARQLIKTYEHKFITPADVSTVVKGYVSVRVSKPETKVERVYVPLQIALDTQDFHGQMADDLRKYLAVVHKKFSMLPEYYSILQKFVKQEIK